MYGTLMDIYIGLTWSYTCYTPPPLFAALISPWAIPYYDCAKYACTYVILLFLSEYDHSVYNSIAGPYWMLCADMMYCRVAPGLAGTYFFRWLLRAAPSQPSLRPRWPQGSGLWGVLRSRGHQLM